MTNETVSQDALVEHERAAAQREAERTMYMGVQWASPTTTWGGARPEATTQPYPTDMPYDEPRASCQRDTHYFECRHETRCRCGRTYRPVNMGVPQGL